MGTSHDAPSSVGVGSPHSIQLHRMILCLQLLKLNRKSDKQQDLSYYQVPGPSKRTLDFSDMLEVWNKDDETGSLSPTFFRLQRKKRGKALSDSLRNWAAANQIQKN